MWPLLLAVCALVGLTARLWNLDFDQRQHLQPDERHWSITSGNLAGKVIVGPLFGFAAGWFIDRFGPRRLMLSGILMVGLAVMGLGIMQSTWQFYTFYFLIALG